MFPNPNVGPLWLHSSIARGGENAWKLAAFLDTEEVPDNLYGQLRLNELEVQVINTPEFQRLRYISQLAFAKAAFHTAEHSRFSHSLGVCHVAKILVDRLNANLATAFREGDEQRSTHWQAIAARGNPKRTVAECETEYRSGEIVTWTERVIVGVAGLLHDLPHGPYSHDIEGGSPTVIPKHDDYARNPALPIMLFDTQRSTLARLLAFYSDYFYQLMRHDAQWKNCRRVECYSDPERRPRMLADSIFEVLAFEHASDALNGYVLAHTRKWPDDPVEDPLPTIRWAVTHDDAWQSPLVNADSLPSDDWFQPYRHDLIGDTICADLVDYLARDANNAGVPVVMDFSFLSRLSLNLYGDNVDAPQYLRIVFDLRDTKRGTVRYDVLHELFDYLRERFKIRERITSHRVTHEGAAILKRAMTLLTYAPDGEAYAKPFVTLQDLHMDYRCNSDDALLRHIATVGGRLTARIDSDAAQPVETNLVEEAGGPPRDALLSAAGLAQRLIERRYHRPLVLLTSSQNFDRVRDFAQLFETRLSDAGRDASTGVSANAVIQNIWAIENHVAQRLGSQGHPISDKVIAYVLKPRGGHKEAEMLIATFGEFRPLEVLPLKNATGGGADDVASSRPPRLHGVEEAKHLSKADYLSLWRIFLLVAPELLRNDEDKLTQRAAQDFHRWIRGWRFVRQSGSALTKSPDVIAAMLSDEKLWLDNARELTNSPHGLHDDRWTTDTTNGVDMNKITYTLDELHRCRDIRHAFPRIDSGVADVRIQRACAAADLGQLAMNSSLRADTEPLFIEHGDEAPRLVMSPSDAAIANGIRRWTNALSDAEHRYAEGAYNSCIDHLDVIIATGPQFEASEGFRLRALVDRARVLTQLQRYGAAVADLGAALEIASLQGSSEVAAISRLRECARSAEQAERLILHAASLSDAEAADFLGSAWDEIASFEELRLLKLRVLLAQATGQQSLGQYSAAANSFRDAQELLDSDDSRQGEIEVKRRDATWGHLVRRRTDMRLSFEAAEFMRRQRPDVQEMAIVVRDEQFAAAGMRRQHREEPKVVWEKYIEEAIRRLDAAAG